MRTIARTFEAILWNSRFLALIAVVASLIGALVLFYVAVLDVVSVLQVLLSHGDALLSPVDRVHARGRVVIVTAEFIDTFLFGIVLIIFALGIYELFIAKITQLERSERAERMLPVRNLDDLKERLAKVIFLILIVRYFEFALETPIHTPLDLLALAGGIGLIALGIFLTSPRGPHAE
ncbi:MAG: YqhA family protein [Candidatus Baltobacteraceae bacterium]